MSKDKPTLPGDLKHGDLSQVASDIFIPPTKQAEKMVHLNALWDDPEISWDSIRTLGDPPPLPVFQDGKSLYCVILLYETGDWRETLKRNYEACRCEHGQDMILGRNLYQECMDEGVEMRPYEEAMPRRKGMRWEVFELGVSMLGRGLQVSRSDLCRRRVMGLGQELPFIAAMFPRWARRLDGCTFPFLVAPDIEIILPGMENDPHCPRLRAGISPDEEGKIVFDLTSNDNLIQDREGVGWAR